MAANFENFVEGVALDKYDKRSERKKKGRSFLPIFFLVLCFTFAAAAGAMLASSGLFNSDSNHKIVKESDRENKETNLIKAKDKMTILLMGVDLREDDVGRSDTMMIATVDPKLDRASLLSVPRDTRVRITGYGFDKINAAYAYGGEPLSEKTVENFLGIDIDHYVIINTKSFVKIIDAIGGLDIDVEKRMYYEDPWDDDGGLIIDLYPGVQHMDGQTAVTYVRYRDEEGDIGRIHRQQKFMEACMDKIVSPEIVTKIPTVIREVIDAIDTDMTFRQLLEIAGALKAAQQNGLQTEMVPGYPLYIDGISYWIPDVEELRFAVAAGLGVSVDSDMKKRVQQAASEYHDSIPSTAGEIPEDAETIGRPVRNSRNSDSNSYSERNYDGYYNSRTSETFSERRNYDSRYESDRNSSTRRNYEEPRTYESQSQTDSRYDNRPTYDDYYESRRDSRNSQTQIERRNISDTVDEPFEDVPTRGDSSGRR